MSYKVAVALFAFAVCVYGHTDCGSKSGTVVSVSVSGCAPEASRCTLHRKTNASIEINFTTSSTSDSLKAVVHGVVLGVPIPFNLPNSDGCKDSGVTCPVSSGTTYNYQATLPVLKDYPRVTVDVKWELQDGEGNDVVCVLIPAQIK